MKLLMNAIGKLVAGLLLTALLLFGPAGTWNYPGGWLFCGLLFVPTLILGLVLYLKAPELLKKRLNTKETEKGQMWVVALSGVLFMVSFLAAGLDFRFGWTRLPAPVVALGMVLFCTGYGLYVEVLRENAHLSRTVEVQEGQKVIDTGLYGIVRHPMYLAVTVLFLSMPLVLGSAAALLPFLFVPAVLVKRIRNEEQVLEAGLPGYRAYEKKVKYRMVPFLW